MRIEQSIGLQPNVAGSQNPKLIGKSEDFGQMLMDVLKEVNQTQQNAEQLKAGFLTGQPAVEPHTLMIEMEKAAVAMQLTLAVRNKVLEAYQEISRMQV